MELKFQLIWDCLLWVSYLKIIILFIVLVRQKSFSVGEREVLGKYISELKERKDCPLCHRDFPDKHGREQLIDEVNTTENNSNYMGS